MQPVGIHHRVPAGLADLDVLQADLAQVCGNKLGRGAAVGGMSGDAGDAGNPQQCLVRLEPAIGSPRQVVLEGVVAKNRMRRCVGHGNSPAAVAT